jgi:hypothetical protein
MKVQHFKGDIAMFFDAALCLGVVGLYAAIFFVLKTDYYDAIRECLSSLEYIRQHDRAIAAKEHELSAREHSSQGTKPPAANP